MTLFGLLFTPVFYVVVRWIGTFVRGSARERSLPEDTPHGQM